MSQLIEKYCKELRLGQSIVENYKMIQADTHEAFLEKLLQLEIENRRLARKNRYLKQATFDMIKTFEGYSFEKVKLPNTISLAELKDGKFIDRKENVILYGSVGTGKTHMITAIGVNACNREKTVKFYKTVNLVNDLVEVRKKSNLKKFLEKLAKYDLLICDEWGYIPLDSEGAQLLFQVIAQRYEKGSVAITTNLDFSRWNGIFYDDKITSAIIDRLVHHCHLLVFEGNSYRLEHSSISSA
jgi:DNA replication protein DnaC